MAIDSSNRIARASPTATSGIATKFATSASTISRPLRSGATISATRNPSPVPTMVESTHTIVVIEIAACFRSMAPSWAAGAS